MHPAIWCALYLLLGYFNARNAIECARGEGPTPFFNSTLWYFICMAATGMCGYSLGVELVSCLA